MVAKLELANKPAFYGPPCKIL